MKLLARVCLIVFGLTVLLSMPSVFASPMRSDAHRKLVAKTLFVSPTGDDNNDGTQDKPYKTIQGAINNASSGDTVTLMDGTYAGGGDRDLDFGGKEIKMNSKSGPAKTIIDCLGSQSEMHSAIKFHSNEVYASVIGITMKNGYQNTGGAMFISKGCKIRIESCILMSNTCRNGGAIYNYGDLEIVDSIFENNSSGDEGSGGAIFNAGNAKLEKCQFISNEGGFEGGGIVTNGGKETLTRCIFSENHAVRGGGYSGGGTLSQCEFKKNKAGEGGGAYGGLFDSCDFEDNVAESNGGGLFAGRDINRCTFVNNSSNHGQGGAYYGSGEISECVFRDNSVVGGDGGGLFISEHSVLTNCVIINNSAGVRSTDSGPYGGHGGGISTEHATKDAFSARIIDVSLRYCTISGNKAATAGGAIDNHCSLVFENCIVWGNSSPDAPAINMGEGNPELKFTYTDIQGGISGLGNLKLDPLFVNPQSGDFHLKVGSPCIGAGITISAPAPVIDQSNSTATFSRPLHTIKPGQKSSTAVKQSAPAKITLIPVATDLDGKSRSSGKPTIGAYEGAK